jgi:cytochrome c peroxidase
MRWNHVVRLSLLSLLALQPISRALAQPPPPPPLTPLPPPPQPPGNPVSAAKANLGKTLFWDEQLSSTRTMSCGSCHQATRGGSDPRSLLASAHATNPGVDAVLGTPDDILGSPGVVLNQPDGTFSWSPVFGLEAQVTGRLAPSFINAAYAPELFWDGRARQTFLDPQTGATVLVNGGALENQAAGPPVSSAEMGHLGRSWNDVVDRVSSSRPLMLASHVPTALAGWIGGRTYADLFQEAFGSSVVTAARIAMAIASYERTLFSTQAPFDSVIAGTSALRPQEAAGMQLFGQLGCAGCHAGSLTSDNQFHYIGVRPAAEDPGRQVVTLAPQDLGAFRTPSLRNVELRSAFMHNGRFTSLEEVVDFYDRGGDFDAPNKAPAIRPLNLTLQQKAALVAFLRRPLTDPRVASGAAPFDRPTLYTESGLAPVMLGGGVPGVTGTPPVPVALEPAALGNDRFTVGVHGTPSGAQAVLVIDAAEPPAGGGIPASGSFARRVITLQTSPAGGGYGSATLAIPDDPALVGQTLFARWYVEDGAADGGISASPSFRFTVFGVHQATTPVTVEPVALGRPLALRAGPNPFADRVTARFDLPTASRTRIVVHDVSGRTVRRLQDRVMEAGSHAIEWDGRDEAGVLVAAGVYFYRLETDREKLVARIVRLD